MKKILLLLLLFAPFMARTQNSKWPEGKQALIVLTYDDALDSQLDVAVPQLDKAGIPGTFFLKEPSNEKQLDRWIAISKQGHELANHTVYHPCLSSKFPADPRYHAENYTVPTILREIRTMNQLLYSMDHKQKHTFAYPCYETAVGGKSYMDSLKNCGFVNYARGGGGSPVITDFQNLNLFDVPCMGYYSPPSGITLVNFVKQVEAVKGMGVFIFHGVGGDYLEVSGPAHQELVTYLQQNNKKIWVTTFEKAMDYVKQNLRKESTEQSR